MTSRRAVTEWSDSTTEIISEENLSERIYAEAKKKHSSFVCILFKYRNELVNVSAESQRKPYWREWKYWYSGFIDSIFCIAKQIMCENGIGRLLSSISSQFLFIQDPANLPDLNLLQRKYD